ncbi:MAG TPA: hypothetical protein VKH37_05765, partial [Ferruginibacter sp.]|nr:hypothetical protein [Ferruginibacter sp.]
YHELMCTPYTTKKIKINTFQAYHGIVKSFSIIAKGFEFLQIIYELLHRNLNIFGFFMFFLKKL